MLGSELEATPSHQRSPKPNPIWAGLSRLGCSYSHREGSQGRLLAAEGRPPVPPGPTQHCRPPWTASCAACTGVRRAAARPSPRRSPPSDRPRWPCAASARPRCGKRLAKISLSRPRLESFVPPCTTLTWQCALCSSHRPSRPRTRTLTVRRNPSSSPQPVSTH